VRESARLNKVGLKVCVVLLFILAGACSSGKLASLYFGYTGVFSAAATGARSAGRHHWIAGRLCGLVRCGVGHHDRHCSLSEIPRHRPPCTLALQYAGENWIAGFADLGAILGMTTVILVMTYGQTRIIFAMSRDGLLPKKISGVHSKLGTPFFATWMVGFVFGLVAATVPLNVLTELINIGTLAAFSLISVAVIVLRKTRPDLPRAFRCPAVPLVPLLAIAFCITLTIFLQATTWIGFLVWLAIGLIVYFTYARHRSLLN
jgi:basic amino acid/polyamine antiporter, APA family